MFISCVYSTTVLNNSFPMTFPLCVAVCPIPESQRTGSLWRRSKILVTFLLATSCSNTSLFSYNLICLSLLPARILSCSTDTFQSSPTYTPPPLTPAPFSYFSSALLFPVSFTCPRRTIPFFVICQICPTPSLSRPLTLPLFP